MKRPFIRRPKALAALAGLVVAVGLTVFPAQASNTPYYAKSTSTGTIGNGAAPGGPVTREQIIARAKGWVEKSVLYSQKSGWEDHVTGGPYRRDCSGFVSMAWQLRDSLTTWSLPSVADRLAGFEQLQAGDALDYPARHAVLFGGWTDKAEGDFVYFSESRPGRPARKESANIHDSEIAGHPRTAYIPLRYKKLTTAPAAAPSQPAQPLKAKPKPKPKPQPTATTPTKPGSTSATPAAVTPAATTAPTPGRTAAMPAGSAPTAAPTPPSPATAPTAPANVPVDGPTGSTAPGPGSGCTPARRPAFWAWIFSF
ncbi:hypothetical protein ACU4GG_41130 [Streptomyces nojiriensis]